MGSKNPRSTRITDKVTLIQSEKDKPKQSNKKAGKSRSRSRQRTRRGRGRNPIRGVMAKVAMQPPGDVQGGMSLCDLSPSDLGWLYKVHDPAGASEEARAMGEYSKIPDGLYPQSVDGEIRIVTNLSVPGTDSTSVIDLTGSIWSCTIISHPNFRTAYIAAASRYNHPLGPPIQQALCAALNNLVNYREIVDSQEWIPFSTTNGWYYRIVPLPPNYDLASPLSGTSRTVEAYRMTYKSITVQHNAPTLVDQGYWIGAHYAIPPIELPDNTEVVDGQVTFITARFNPGTITMDIPYLTPQGFTGPADVITRPDGHMALLLSVPNPTVAVVITLDVGIVWYSPTAQSIWADSADTISIITQFVGTDNWIITFTSSRADTVAFTISGFQLPNYAGTYRLNMDLNDTIDNPTSVSTTVAMPALTTEQIMANNPKAINYTMKESHGAYGVHRKMNNEVYLSTPGQTFGVLQFTVPGYDTKLNHNDGSGIQDTTDRNMSAMVIAIFGIAWANNLVAKVYVGWEGQTNTNTPFGQFGHCGAEKNEPLLTLSDNINVRLPGMYPAKYNFLAAVCGFIKNTLGRILASSATQAHLKHIGNQAIEAGLSHARKYGQGLMQTV